jgi:hypothetical protein
MKVPAKGLIISTLLIAESCSRASAFITPNFGRFGTKLDITVLEEWQLLDDGTIIGSVRDHPTISDGDVITTSPLAYPAVSSLSPDGGMLVSTLTGSQYKLGTPLRVRKITIPTDEQPAIDRSRLILSAGLLLFIAAGGGVDIDSKFPENN